MSHLQRDFHASVLCVLQQASTVSEYDVTGRRSEVTRQAAAAFTGSNWIRPEEAPRSERQSVVTAVN